VTFHLLEAVELLLEAVEQDLELLATNNREYVR
jgi:hypothetical protein